jgi:hypothetical protein
VRRSIRPVSYVPRSPSCLRYTLKQLLIAGSRNSYETNDFVELAYLPQHADEHARSRTGKLCLMRLRGRQRLL